MSHEHGERVPLTIADFDREKGTITLVIQAVGKTTREMQQTCQTGTSLHAVVGPMGIPSHIGEAKKAKAARGSQTAAATIMAATYADLTKKPVTLEVAEEAVGLRAGPGDDEDPDPDAEHPSSCTL